MTLITPGQQPATLAKRSHEDLTRSVYEHLLKNSVVPGSNTINGAFAMEVLVDVTASVIQVLAQSAGVSWERILLDQNNRTLLLLQQRTLPPNGKVS